jgi:hypothetical protein
MRYLQFTAPLEAASTRGLTAYKFVFIIEVPCAILTSERLFYAGWIATMATIAIRESLRKWVFGPGLFESTLP